MPFIYEREYVFRCDNIRALYARLTPHDRALLRWDPRGDRVAPLLARRAHARPREVDLPQPRGGVQGAARSRSTPTRTSSRCSRRRPSTIATARRCAFCRRPTATTASRAAPLHLRATCRTWPIASRRCCASAAWRAGDKVMLRLGEPARVGHHLLRHLEGGRRGRAGRLAVERRRGAEPRRLGARARGGAQRQGARALERDRRALWRRRDHPLRGSLAGRAQGGAGGAGAPPEGGRPGVAHLHVGDDRAAQGRHVVAPQLRVAVVEARRACSTSTSTTASCRSCRCITPSSSPRACSCRSCAARRSPTSRRSTPTRSTRRVRRGQHHRHGRRAGAVADAAPQGRQDRRRSRAAGPSASSTCSIEGNRALRDQMPPALDGLTLLNWGKLLFWPVHQKFGGRLRLLISGGSALPTETDEGVPRPRLQPVRGLRPDRSVAGAHGESARHAPPPRHRRRAAARHRRAHRQSRRARRRRDRRQRAQRHARLLRKSRRDRRRSSTRRAGCTPATSAASTTTGACTSSGARRR